MGKKEFILQRAVYALSDWRKLVQVYVICFCNDEKFTSV